MNSQEKTLSSDAGSRSSDPGVGQPRKGDRYRCASCGMALDVTADCHCKQGAAVHFHCCGQELQKV